jgi:hypothetical protein
LALASSASPCQHENFANSSEGIHILELKEVFLLPKIVFARLVLKEKCMSLPIQERPLFHPIGFWSSFMWIYLVLPLMKALVGRSIAWLLLMAIQDIHGLISAGEE